MSVGNNLQEMENVVNKNAAPAEPMHKGPQEHTPGSATPGQGAIEDLGGPTPENYKVDNDSAKLKTPGKTLKQVRDVVNKNATPGDQAMPTMKKEEERNLKIRWYLKRKLQKKRLLPKKKQLKKKLLLKMQ